MTDNLEIIICPACGKEMKKIYSEINNFNIDICLDGCGGIYLDNREIKFFDEQHENISEILEAYCNKDFETVEDVKRVCPVCGTNMVKHYSSVHRAIMIDECYNCGGKFLDNGELEAIRDEFATEEQRSKALLDIVMPNISIEFERLDKEHEKYQNSRSLLKKFFDKIYFGS